jgi:predicted permease
MQTLLPDLRYAARMLLKKPGFTLVAIITLALGIGANTAIFSLVNATLLRPLPVVEPERLVYVFSGNPGAPYNASSYPDYVDFRDQSQVFSGLACWGGIAVGFGDGAQTDLVIGAIVSGNYFDVLGVRAAQGRTLTHEDDQQPGAHPVAVIGHNLWQQRFGGAADIIGRQIRLNGQPFTVIGVLPAEFKSVLPGRTDDLYVPMMQQAWMRPPRGGYSGEMNPDLLRVRGNRWLTMIGRLQPDATPEQARAALIPITEQQAQIYPDTNRNRIVTVTRVNDGDPQSRGSLVQGAVLLLAVVGIVLLIACANVANLLLARAAGRRKEIAVRLALGAGRWRLMRQLLTESVLLALLGGAAGLLLAIWWVDLLKAAPPPPGVLPISPDFSLDWRVLGFTLGLSVLTGIVFGLAPALQAARADLVPALKDEAVTFDQRQRRFNLRNALVVAQVALSLVLLIGASLFLRSLWRMQAVQPGFDEAKLLGVPLNINLLRYTRAQGRDFYRQATERVAALPGVEAVSLTRVVPLSGGSAVRGLMIEGQGGADNNFRSEGGGATASSPDTLSVSVVGQNYFQTMGINLRRGRDFTATDTEDSPSVIIVNETFAQRYFPGQEVLGKRLSLNGARGPWRAIVGVARDSKYVTLSEAAMPFAYLPLAQNHETGMTLLVRAQGSPASLTAAVRQAVQTLEPNLPITGVRTMTELIGNTLYAARMGAILIGVFGALALLLAAIGLYGVLSYAVAQRTREIGVRMALGAQAGDVLRLVLREALTLVGIGLVMGWLAAAGAARLLSGFLYGISTLDAVTFVALPVLLTLVALGASLIPARRATKVDPLIALRYE